MKSYTEVQIANVQNYLLWKGHACPTVVGNTVHYICQTKGNIRHAHSEPISSVLEEIANLKRIEIDDYPEGSYSAGSIRVGVNIYQIMETKDKLLYIEELPLKLWGKF